MLSVTPDFDRSLQAQDAQQLVHQALDGLSPKDRDVLSLALRNDLDATEVAAALGTSTNQARASISRAKAALTAAVTAVLLTRQQAECPALQEAIKGLDGFLTPLMRKRVSRHVKECPSCEEQGERRALSYVSGFALPVAVALPVGFAAKAQASVAELAASGTFPGLGPVDEAGFPIAEPDAAGPWIDFANQAMGQQSDLIGGTKGSHLVLNHPELRAAIGDHEFFFENSDGRIVLICPLEDRVLIGTSDIRIDNPDEARCTEEEIDYFLSMTARVFPSITVNRSHIVFTFSGVRPLPAANAKSTGQISRDHSIEVMEPSATVNFPVLNLVGGKWTTFRAFAEQTADRVLQRLAKSRQMTTADQPIGGGKAYPTTPAARAAWIERASETTGLTNAQLDQLFQRYGTLAATIGADIAANRADGAAEPLQHLPSYLQGEIRYLARTEKVVHLDDFILRRSSLAMLGMVTKPLLEELSRLLGAVLGWSAEEQQAEVDRTVAQLAAQHRMHL